SFSLLFCFFFFFFFSSRRRHTRSLRDWSSDVCSSDLGHIVDRDDLVVQHHPGLRGGRTASNLGNDRALVLDVGANTKRGSRRVQIGRASCRERGEDSGGGGGGKKERKDTRRRQTQSVE